MPNYWLSSEALNIALEVVEETGQSHSVQEQTDAVSGFTASAVLRCPWLNRDEVISDLLGNAVAYARFPDAGAHARTVSCRAADGMFLLDGFLHQPEYAILTVSYSQNEAVDETTGQLFSESLEPNAEFITLDFRKFRWGSATGKKLTAEQAPGKLVIGLDYVQTRFGLPSLPVDILEPGLCNEASITASLLGLTFPAETLMYVNSTPTRTITTAGSAKWQMSSRFSYRKQGWNTFWHEDKSGGPGWDKIFLDEENGGAEYKNFPPGDFTGVLI